MILVAKFGEANHELRCDFKITAQPKKEYFDGGYEVEITENGTTTFATEGKYCDKNIAVNVNIPTGEEIADALISATLSGAYRNDRVTTIKQYCFAAMTKLTSVDLPNATSVSAYCFNNCYGLVNINLPKVATFSSYEFWGCKSLPSASFPLASTIGNSMFRGCTVLERVYIPSATSIGACAFQDCKSLIKVILGGTSVCTLENTNAFNYCYHILGTKNVIYNPEGLKDGYIYAPDDLVEEYKVATNWATYASQIMPRVDTIDDLARIDTTLYDHACVVLGDDTFTEYYFNGTEWEVFVR